MRIFIRRTISRTLLPLIKSRSFMAVALSVAVLGGVGGSASAFHAWGGYHWARQSNPFTLQLTSNLSSSWKPHLLTSSSDWSQSAVLNTEVVDGSSNPKTCRAVAGRVEVCNAKYGKNGWLGLAQIWLNGSHITQGTAKMNDTYFTMPQYNTPAEKNHVMCQEVGHTFGLGHQDESGAVLDTCMDYSTADSSQHPNLHDYEELTSIYQHPDTSTTVGTVSAPTQATRDQRDLNARDSWGRRVFRTSDGLAEIHEKTYQDGSKLVSLVILAHHE